MSTGKLSRDYYKMHLEAVHNVQQNVDRLLEWSLSEQSVGVGSGDTTVTNNLKVSKFICI